MARITNLTRRQITLPTGHVIPRLGDLPTDNETLALIDIARVLPALIAAGEIAVEYDPDPAATPTPVEPVETAPKTLKGA